MTSNDADVTNLKDYLSTEASHDLVLTIKNYKTAHGLSKLIHDHEKRKDHWAIKGPMGKGLGLTADSKNYHIAFAAGTGILPFIDLVARLAMQELGVLPKDQHFDKDFKLELHVSFPSYEESIGYDLVEALQAYMKEKGDGQTRFKLIVRYSSEQFSKRWDKEYLRNHLKAHIGNITKIWVCGPPMM